MSIQIAGSAIPPDGTVTAPKINSGSSTVGFVLTADGVGGAAWETVPSSGPGYLVYVAKLAQSGTNAPVATVLFNTLGVITWTRGGAGYYNGGSANLFTVGKTFCSATFGGGAQARMPMLNSSTDVLVQLATYSLDNNMEDGTGAMYHVEIRVYP